MKAFTAVMNIYINLHIMTNLSTDLLKLTVRGTQKEAHRHKKTYVSAKKVCQEAHESNKKVADEHTDEQAYKRTNGQLLIWIDLD